MNERLSGPARATRARAGWVVVMVGCVGLLPSPAPAQVILNEVLADPAGDEHHEEFVELRNLSATDSLDLSGWRVGDGDELDAIVDAGWGTVLAPGRLAVVLDASYFGNSTAYDSVREFARIVTIEDRSFGRGGWSNTAPERVLLSRPDGEVVDAFQYDPADGLPGHSWERVQGGRPEWRSSYLPGGTPGRTNSVEQSPAAARRVEIGASPDPFHDRLEILCRVPEAPSLLAVTVFDVQGRRVKRLRGWGPAALETRVIWDGRDASGVPSPPGLYVILAQSSAAGRVASGRKVVARSR